MFDPRVLTDEEREGRLHSCFELQNQVKEDPETFFKVIIGDESWGYGYDPETKQQLRQWKTGLVHAEFVSPGGTGQLEVLLGGYGKIEGKYPEDMGRFLAHNFLYDNAPVHTTLFPETPMKPSLYFPFLLQCIDHELNLLWTYIKDREFIHLVFLAYSVTQNRIRKFRSEERRTHKHNETI
ncbi:uncharacterized protein LOC116168464 [Photinus pyralis]|uniref:uncharacterized protein LOC116168464 n=1 Tax=Photinus pyralis TaxID=7054 RepID=UPI0012675F9F|nr:uncharacterized protein LOC116168464 [Photinus pyralis]